MEPIAERPPTDIRVSPDRRLLKLRWAEGEQDELTAELLRVRSPSAEVQGHSPDQRRTVGGKRDVAIADIRPVGHYAIRIVFDDGHDSGLFTWRFLAQLSREREASWNGYLRELDEKGLSRDPG
ncbi:MAG: DUF971 domain-containing protein [Methylobacterium sp.]